jgi:hypothetical protein
VIDYQTQQEKIFPLLAAAYAFLFTGNMMVQEYNRINADMEKGRFDEMQVVSAYFIYEFFSSTFLKKTRAIATVMVTLSETLTFVIIFYNSKCITT